MLVLVNEPVAARAGKEASATEARRDIDTSVFFTFFSLSDVQNRPAAEAITQRLIHRAILPNFPAFRTEQPMMSCLSINPGKYVVFKISGE